MFFNKQTGCIIQAISVLFLPHIWYTVAVALTSANTTQRISTNTIKVSKHVLSRDTCEVKLELTHQTSS